MRRRALIAGLAASAVASPALARPLIRLLDQPRDLLSPPFVDGDGRNLTLADFEGRVRHLIQTRDPVLPTVLMLGVAASIIGEIFSVLGAARRLVLGR